MSEPVAEALRQSSSDPAAFADFYAEHADGLLGYFMKRVFDVELAMDLTAETMARAFVYRGDFRGSTDAAAAAWLYSTGERLLATYFRRRRVENQALRLLELEPPRPSDDVEAQLIERDTLSDFRQVLDVGLGRLSSSQRDVLELRFIEGLPHAEIAQRLGITERAARSRLSRGVRTLQRTIGKPSMCKERTA